jgi:hypothetical protein
MLRDKYNNFNDSQKKDFKTKLKKEVGITVKNFLERDCKKELGKIPTERLLTYIEILQISTQEIKKALPRIAILIPKQRKTKTQFIHE